MPWLGHLPQPWVWLLVGRGDLQATVQARADGLGIGDRLRWVTDIPHDQVPSYINLMDTLVLPWETTDTFKTLTSRGWKEQFGHVLIELYRHSHEYDLAHIHALFSPLSTAAATVGLPYVLRPLGTLDPADLQKKKRLKQLYGHLFEAPNIAGAAALHFTSPIEAEVSHRFGATVPDWVMPLGVQPSPSVSVPERQQILAQLGIPSDRPLPLYLSRLDPKKGLDLLLPALEQLTAQGLDFHLVLAGGNPQDPAYSQAIGDRLRATPLGDRNTLTGFVTGVTKAALLQAADVFGLPSSYENFGIAVAEVMAAGVPVVVSKGVYIWPDIVASGSGWVCDLTPEGVAEALAKALGNLDQSRQRRRQAQAYGREHYDWNAIAHQTLAAYHGVLSPGQMPTPAQTPIL